MGVEYAIRDIVLAARKVEQTGMKVDYLNIGDPVQFGFQPPDNVKQALINSIKNGENYYSTSEGLFELREEIAKKENAKGLSITADDILITNGVSEGLDMVISSILMSLGMMMLSPMLVALPFKLLLFVLVDGWSMTVGSLVSTFAAG